MLRTLLSLFCCFMSLFTLGQIRNSTGFNNAPFQFGASAKLQVSFAFREHRYLPPIYRLGLNGGVMYSAWQALSPSYNLEIQIYNGGLGSRAYRKDRPLASVDFVNAFTLTGGTDYRFTRHREDLLAINRVPLYYFADFVYPALSNPYHFSLSAGTNFIFSTDRGKKSQRVGFINVHQGRFQFSYYNDGGALIKSIRTGDRYDRYYTGGGVFSYQLNPEKSYINLIELGFHKFSGFTENAFNLSNLAGLSFVNYSDEAQEYYNKGCYSLHLANTNNGFGLTLRRENDYSNDFQSLIHYVLYDAYHQMPYPADFSISADYMTSQQKINIK